MLDNEMYNDLTVARQKKRLREGQYHMTGILDSLTNVMLSLEGGFQSTDNKY